jgi:hypothetical protein
VEFGPAELADLRAAASAGDAVARTVPPAGTSSIRDG